MGLLLRQIFQMIRLLNSDTGLYSLAWGFSFGCVLGFSPFLSLQTMIVLIICLFFRVQLGAAFVSSFFFKFVAFLIDSWADQLGRWVLENESLRPIFTQMYNMPLVPFTRFNDSIVMGSGIVGFGLAIPLFFTFTYLIKKYREVFVVRFRESRFWKLWTGTVIYKWYSKYQELYG